MQIKNSISVILPVYNEEEILQETLYSVSKILEKDFENYEIIVVDDGSKDRSLELLNNLANEIKNLNVVENHINLNQGISIQRGIAISKNDIIIHNGIDMPFKLEYLKEYIENHWINKNVDVLVVERDYYTGSSSWRKFTSICNKVIRKMFFPILTKGINDMNYIQFYSRKSLQFILPLAKSPAFTTAEMILRAKINSLNVKTIACKYEARVSGNSSLGKFHDICWSFYDMFRFRLLLWIGLKKNEKAK